MSQPLPEGTTLSGLETWLGIKPPEDLTEVCRMRLEWDLLLRLDRLESYARGKGLRTANRSALIRAAIERYLTDLGA